jgi:hypothetical protein
MDNLNIHRRKSLMDLLGEPLGAEVWECFTLPLMEAGLIRPKSKSDCSRISASAGGDSRSGDTAARNSRMESPDEPPPRQNQLAIRRQGRASQVPL